MTKASNWYAKKFGGSPSLPQPVPQQQQGFPFSPTPQPSRQPSQQGAVHGPGGIYHQWGTVTGGGGGVTKDIRDVCPSCGSGNYMKRDVMDSTQPSTGAFSIVAPRLRRLGKMTQSGFVPPSSHCFECGYNDVFEHDVPPDDAGGAVRLI